MDIKDKEFINLFKKMSDQNPLHESLLSLLHVSPVRDGRSLKYLLTFLYKHNLLKDEMAVRYIQCTLNGSKYLKVFNRMAEELVHTDSNVPGKNRMVNDNISKYPNKKTIKNVEMKSSSISEEEQNEEVDIEAFTSATHYMDWNHVRKGKKSYIFKPLFENIKVKELVLKPVALPLLDIKGLNFFYKWMPPVRYRVDKQFNISQFEFSAFSESIKHFDRLLKLWENPIERKKVQNIYLNSHVLDWNHIMGTKEEYIIQPKIFGLKVKPINIKRNKRPIYISHLIKKYANGLPDVTFRITENIEIEGLNIQLIEEIIDFCVAKEQQWEAEEAKRISEEKQRMKEDSEKRKKNNEENRKRKLLETYERLRMEGVDTSIFETVFKLKWSDVKFYKRYFVFEPRLDKYIGHNRIFPLRIDDYRCRDSFNYILDYFQERLPKIVYRITMDFKIKLDNKPAFEAALADLSKEQARVDAGVSIMSSAGRFRAIVKRSFDSAMSKAAAMNPEEFKKYKSKFIDYLVAHQSKDYKIVPVSENVSHSRSSYDEASFIFTARSFDSCLFIIIENVNPDRSTLLFKVLPEKYKDALHAIYDYIQSDIINKRSAIRDHELNFGSIGILYYKTFNHDSYTDWMYRLRGYLV